jgi:hypothetical protein
MRLLQSILTRRQQTKQPPHKFVPHLLGRMRMRPGHAPCRQLSRYRPSHERTLSRGDARDFDWVSLTKAASTAVVPPAHAQAVGREASCVPNSGQTPYGLERCWHGSHRRPEKGLALATRAWLDIPGNGAYGLSGAQTPPTGATPAPEATRMDGALAPLTRGVPAQA